MTNDRGYYDCGYGVATEKGSGNKSTMFKKGCGSCRGAGCADGSCGFECNVELADLGFNNDELTSDPSEAVETKVKAAMNEKINRVV